MIKQWDLLSQDTVELKNTSGLRKKKTGHVQRKYVHPWLYNTMIWMQYQVRKSLEQWLPETTKVYQDKTNANVVSSTSSKASTFIKRGFWARRILGLTPVTTTAVLLQMGVRGAEKHSGLNARESNLGKVPVQRACKNENNCGTYEEGHKPEQIAFKHSCEWHRRNGMGGFSLWPSLNRKLQMGWKTIHIFSCPKAELTFKGAEAIIQGLLKWPYDMELGRHTKTAALRWRKERSIKRWSLKD